MATYKIKTKRYIRKYTAAEKLPVSAALIDAQRVVDELCKVPWEQAAETTSVITSHDESELDANVSNRDRFDAALFCADHANGAHRAYANAACYKIPFPTGTAGKKITSLKVRVTSDAYNAAGARIALVTNSTGVIPTSCAECRGEGSGGIHAAGVAPQTIQTVGGQRYGYPTIADCIFKVSPGEGEYALPTGGLTLGSYLYVFVLMENYNSVRGNWLEGSSCIVNQIEIVTDSAITGWTDGGTIDLTADPTKEFNVVKDGCYPCNLTDRSGLESIVVQRNGDPLVRRDESTPELGEDGLFSLTNGALSKILDVSPDDIINVCPVTARTGTSTFVYLAICGRFSGGSFSEIPGLYLYDLQKNALVKSKSLEAQPKSSGATVPYYLRSFATDHGGISGAAMLQFDANGCGLFLVGHDGTTLVPSGGTGIAPMLSIGPEASDSSDFYLYQNAAADSSQSLVNVLSGLSLSNAYCKASVHSANFSTSASGAEVKVAIGYVGTSGSSKVFSMVVRGFQKIGYSSYSGTTTTWNDGPLTVNVNECNIGFFFGTNRALSCVLSGDIESFSMPGYSFGEAIALSVWFDGSTMGGASWLRSSRPHLIPDSFSGYSLNGGIGSVSDWANGYAYISGDFNKLGSVSIEKVAKMSFASGNPISSVAYPQDTGKIHPLFSVGDQIFLAQKKTQPEDRGWYDHVHTDITDAQSAIGLRTAYAELYRAKSKAVPVDLALPEGGRLGALFTVRGGSIVVPVDAEGTTEAVPVWKIAASVLPVTFSVPTSFTPRKIRLDWSGMTATSGSKVNVWIRKEAVDEIPRITDPAIFDASKPDVSGWKLVGTIAASGTTATLDVDLSGTRLATLLFTAFVNLDGLNPSSSMTLPQGVGTANVDLVNGTVAGLDTGFRPDITLLG